MNKFSLIVLAAAFAKVLLLAIFWQQTWLSDGLKLFLILIIVMQLKISFWFYSKQPVARKR